MAQLNNREVAELLIRHGVDVNSKDNVSSTPIPVSDVSLSHNNNNYIIYLILYEQSLIRKLVICNYCCWCLLDFLFSISLIRSRMETRLSIFQRSTRADKLLSY